MLQYKISYDNNIIKRLNKIIYNNNNKDSINLIEGFTNINKSTLFFIIFFTLIILLFIS